MMIRTFWLALAVTLSSGLSALAQEAYAEDEGSAPLLPAEDSDLSGDWSLSEMQTAWPALTEQGFAAIDIDGSGGVTLEELQTAYDNRLIRPPQTEASAGSAP